MGNSQEDNTHTHTHTEGNPSGSSCTVALIIALHLKLLNTEHTPLTLTIINPVPCTVNKRQEDMP